MAKRHTLRSGDLESIMGRLEELVLANSGEDEFEEIFKLLVAKLFSEMYPDAGNEFHVKPTYAATAESINSLLAKANEKWRGILVSPSASRLRDEHLAVCVEALQEESLADTNLEVLDAAFEYLFTKAEKGAKGQYFTPRYVIDCCIEVMGPSPSEIILDPACGSAGFLIHTLNYVRLHYPQVNIAEYCRNNLWGSDFDHRAIRVAKALMLIAGDGHSNLYRLNSLMTPETNPSLFDFASDEQATPWLTIEDVARSRMRNFKGFDMILTNPPFAGEVRERNILDAYTLSRSEKRIERDVLFLERCVRLLRPSGRLAIILPHNKFGSASWAYVRDWLIQHVRVVAVLGLGRNTFLPHTHQKASILFGIKRERPTSETSKEEILFLISEKDGKDSTGQILIRPESKPNDPVWSRADHDLTELVAEFQAFIQSHKIGWRAF